MGGGKVGRGRELVIPGLVFQRFHVAEDLRFDSGHVARGTTVVVGLRESLVGQRVVEVRDHVLLGQAVRNTVKRAAVERDDGSSRSGLLDERLELASCAMLEQPEQE